VGQKQYKEGLVTMYDPIKQICTFKSFFTL